jgi:type IV secretory pathway VirB10-like protein
MTMKPALLLVFGIISTIAMTPAHAQVYQWKDSSGRTVIADTPPPGTATRDARVIGDRQPVSRSDKPAEPTAEGPKTTAEKDLEFKKRQQEAREKAEKNAKEQKAQADREENCRRARGNLAALESGRLVGTIDEKGERKAFEDTQRQAEIDRARQFIAEACK